MSGGAAELSIILRARDEASRVLNGVERTSSGLGRTLGNFGRAAGLAFGAASVAAVGFGIASGVQMAARMEQAEIMFGTLLGSADAARERLGELSRFSATTPFELPGIIEADRLLQTFGARTIENLTLVGDAAAGVSLPIEEVSFWFARAYDSINSGRPFGEAAARLQEMGLLSGTARTRMEELQASGASSAEVFGVLQGEFGRFGGLMEQQSMSMSGLFSTLQDSFNLLMGSVIRPFAPLIQQTMGAAIQALNSPAIQSALTGFANVITEGLGRAADFVRGFIDTVQSVLADPDITTEANHWVGVVERIIVAFLEAKQVVLDFIDSVRPTFQAGLTTIREAWEALQPHVERFFTYIIDNQPLLVATMLAVGAVLAVALAPGVVALLGIILLVGLVRQHWDMLRDHTVAIFDQVATKIDEKMLFVDELITRVVGEIVSFFRDNWQTIRTIFETDLEAIRLIVQNAMDTVRDIFRIANALFHGEWGEAWDAIKNLVTDRIDFIRDLFINRMQHFHAVFTLAWEAIKQVFGGALDFIQFVVVGAFNVVRDTITRAMGAARDVLVGAWDAITGATRTAGETIWGVVVFAFTAVKNFITTTFGDLVNAGLQFGVSIANAIGAGFKAAWNAVAGIVNVAIPNSIPIPFAPDIDLPDNPLPILHSGGIVPGRPGQQVLALLEAGERVIPRSAASRAGGGGVTIINNNYFEDHSPAAIQNAVKMAGLKLGRRYSMGI